MRKCVDWVYEAQDKDSCEHGTASSGSIKGGQFFSLP
jgi:hypothetical protein